MALFNKMDSRREVKFTSSAWKWYYSFNREIYSFVEFFKSKHIFKNCGPYCKRGPNYIWGGQIIFKSKSKIFETFFEKETLPGHPLEVIPHSVSETVNHNPVKTWAPDRSELASRTGWAGSNTHQLVQRNWKVKYKKVVLYLLGLATL